VQRIGRINEFKKEQIMQRIRQNDEKSEKLRKEKNDLLMTRT
jgi:hypothetical protein